MNVSPEKPWYPSCRVILAVSIPLVVLFLLGIGWFKTPVCPG